VRTLGNVLWHLSLGFVHAAWVFLLGAMLTLTIVGAPLGLGVIELSRFLLAPFSRVMVSKRRLGMTIDRNWSAYSTLVAILYLPFGLVIAAALLLPISVYSLTVVGFPTAVALAKSLRTCINPVNMKCVPQAVAEEVERRGAMDTLNRLQGPATPAIFEPAPRRHAAAATRGSDSERASDAVGLISLTVIGLAVSAVAMQLTG